jgi:hypothetical protein
LFNLYFILFVSNIIPDNKKDKKMKKIILLILIVGFAFITNCAKKDTSARDSLLTTFVAGTGGSASGSCLLSLDAATNTYKYCARIDGPAPVGVDFSATCTTNSGKMDLTKTCTELGYTKNCQTVSVGGFGVNKITCEK